MGKARLNKSLLEKMARKLKRTPQSVREGISKRASRRDMTAEAAQVQWAKELNISTAGAFQALAPHLQQQVRDRRPSAQTAARATRVEPASSRSARRPDDGIREAINLLLVDPEVKARCADLLRARRKFDRPVNQATLVLEDRLRTLGNVKERLVGASLAAKVLHPKNPLLRISDENDVQEGIYFVCAGLVSVFRNPTHHHLTDKVTREDALSVCGFVDAILRILDQGKRVQPASASPSDGSPRPAAPVPQSQSRSEKREPTSGEIMAARRSQIYKDHVRRIMHPDEPVDPEY